MGKITGPWRCFHCGEICASEAHATEHFGGTRGALAGCQLTSSDRHLLTALREAEKHLAAYRAEDGDILRAMYSMKDDHQRALVQAEQSGYDKGVRDGRALAAEAA
jgi:hypothetical protein